MIHTDGKQTIANRPYKVKTAYTPEDALEAAYLLRDFVNVEGKRGPQANGQQWNEDRCACGGEICDSPAGDKCWDCFNHEPGE